jgi:hypothetical protein
MAYIAGPCLQSPIICSHNHATLRGCEHLKDQVQARTQPYYGPSRSTHVLWGTQEGPLDQRCRTPHLGHTLALLQEVPLAERLMQMRGAAESQHPRSQRRKARAVVVDWPR